MDLQTVLHPIYLIGEQVSVVEHEKYFGNFLSTNIYDRNNISNVCDLYQRSNLLISDFRPCYCITLDSLFNTYCMHMYGCELWDLSCKYIDEFKVQWWQKESGPSAILAKKEQTRVKRPNKSRKTANLYLKYNMYK